ncbi:hypothetical protein [Pseudonocardia sp. GCM10023141]|uniref:hypothetical protein n=1 Tax=Pseudonocardia sp. GCM10023141 TaxID=3252653 RepID=UPI00360BFF77
MTTTTETPTPTRTRRPRTVLGLAIAFVLLVFVGGTINVTIQMTRSSLQQTSTITPQADRLTVNGADADVTLAPSPDGNVHVVTSVTYGGSRPALREESTAAGGVVLEPSCTDTDMVACEIGYHITVPAGLAVTVQVRRGSVYAGDLTGPVTVSQESGAVELHKLTGRLDLTTADGYIHGDRLRSRDVTARATGWGGISLDMVAPPKTLTTSSGNGSTTIVVPNNVPYRVGGTSGTGNRSVGVVQFPSADNTITADSGRGDVRVRGQEVRPGFSDDTDPYLPEVPIAPVEPVAPVPPG